MTEKLDRSLREAGLRVTRPRVAVLDAVRANQHADASEILRAVRAQLPAVSHQAVYDCLSALTASGLVRKIEPAGSPPGTSGDAATTITTWSADPAG